MTLISTKNVLSGDINEDKVQKIQSSFICPGEGYFPDGKLKSLNTLLKVNGHLATS